MKLDSGDASSKRCIGGRGGGVIDEKKKGDRFQPHPRGMFATLADEKRSPCPHRIYIEIELLILAGATDCFDPTCQFYGFNELQTPKCIASISFELMRSRRRWHVAKTISKAAHQRYIYKYGVINMRTNVRILFCDIYLMIESLIFVKQILIISYVYNYLL